MNVVAVAVSDAMVAGVLDDVAASMSVAVVMLSMLMLS